MRCLYFDGQPRFRRDYPVPRPTSGEALIRVRYAGVCNTDREIVRGYKGFTGILGHEFVGVVEEGPPEWMGRRVVGGINIGCGVCELCQAGLDNHCRERFVPGIVGKDGAFAEYLTLPVANLYAVPDTVSDLEAVFAEPLAAALEICEQCHIRPSQRIAILGDGKLGQLVARVLSLTGCELTMIGKHEEKLALAAGHAVTVLAAQAGKTAPYDVVVECTGSPGGLACAQEIVKPRGVIVIKSTFAVDITAASSLWVVKEFSLVGSRCGPTAAALRLLAGRAVDVKPLIGGVFPFDEDAGRALSLDGMKAIFDLGL